MALLQISEPGQSSAPHQHKLSVGIDLGTTNSLVASVRNGLAETLADEDGEHLLPSVVQYFDAEITAIPLTIYSVVSSFCAGTFAALTPLPDVAEQIRGHFWNPRSKSFQMSYHELRCSQYW